jgi:hypothetical protein
MNTVIWKELHRAIFFFTPGSIDRKCGSDQDILEDGRWELEDGGSCKLTSMSYCINLGIMQMTNFCALNPQISQMNADFLDFYPRNPRHLGIKQMSCL